MKSYTSSSGLLRRPSDAQTSKTQYWAEDHDAAAWSAEFRRLASEAHGGSSGGGTKKNKRALAAYRQMRLDVESQTRGMCCPLPLGGQPPPPTRAPIEASEPRLVGRDAKGGAGARIADPLAVASHLDCALLLPLRHCKSSADGDLESQCRRRCHGHFPVESTTGELLFGADLTVVRGIEHDGYPVFPPGETWSLRAVGYGHRRSERRLPSLRISQGRKALEDRLFRELAAANERRGLGECLVLAGVPFCSSGSGSRGDEDRNLRAAEVAARALSRAGVKRVVLAGQNAQVSAGLFQSALSGLASGEQSFAISVSVWQGEMMSQVT